jgi:hypothetical protein
MPRTRHPFFAGLQAVQTLFGALLDSFLLRLAA